MITVTIETSDLTRKLADFPEALARAQRVALLKIGNIVKTHARDAIKGKALVTTAFYNHPYGNRQDAIGEHVAVCIGCRLTQSHREWRCTG